MAVPFQARGAWTALITPFSSSGAFDSEGFAKLVEFQVKQGIHGLVPCGTTGESPTLSWEEHRLAVELSAKAAGDRAGVLAGTGSNSTAEAIQGSLDAQSHGASAVLLVDCYYNGPSSLELRTEYYERVLAEVPALPLVPYVIPGRTGCALGAEDLAILHLSHPSRVPGIKSSTGDFDRMRRDRALAGPSLGILSGDDDLTLAMMQDPAIRGTGVISVMANLAPASVAQMVSAQLAGRADEANRLDLALAPLFKLVTCRAKSSRRLPDGREIEVEDRFRNPVAVKTMMAGLGLIGSGFRRPLGLMTPAGVAQCRSALLEVLSKNPEILAPLESAFGISLGARLADDSVWSQLSRRA